MKVVKYINVLFLCVLYFPLSAQAADMAPEEVSTMNAELQEIPAEPTIADIKQDVEQVSIEEQGLPSSPDAILEPTPEIPEMPQAPEPITGGMQEVLEQAIGSADSDAVLQAIKDGADVNAPTSNQLLPLGNAIDAISAEWANQCHANKSVPVLKVLLEQGADVNKKDKAGISAMAYAVLRLDPGLVDLLLQHGGNRNPEIPFPSHGDWNAANSTIGAQEWLEKKISKEGPRAGREWLRITKEILANLKGEPAACPIDSAANGMAPELVQSFEEPMISEPVRESMMLPEEPDRALPAYNELTKDKKTFVQEEVTYDPSRLYINSRVAFNGQALDLHSKIYSCSLIRIQAKNTEDIGKLRLVSARLESRNTQVILGTEMIAKPEGVLAKFDHGEYRIYCFETGNDGQPKQVSCEDKLTFTIEKNEQSCYWGKIPNKYEKPLRMNRFVKGDRIFRGTATAIAGAALVTAIGVLIGVAAKEAKQEREGYKAHPKYGSDGIIVSNPERDESIGYMGDPKEYGV